MQKHTQKHQTHTKHTHATDTLNNIETLTTTDKQSYNTQALKLTPTSIQQ